MRRADRWEASFSHLKKYVERVGDARVSDSFHTSDGYALGRWVTTQRTKRSEMAPEARARLESLGGWTWDPYGEQWDDGFAHLEAFYIREGHTRVPPRFKAADGHLLGGWVSTQRRAQLSMAGDRVARLEALKGWTWKPVEARWEEGFDHLKRYVEAEGHTGVARHLKATDGYPVGEWVYTQRRERLVMSGDRVSRLEALDGWSWDRVAVRWEVGFVHLKDFVECKGTAFVTAKVRAEDGYWLGMWVRSQRQKRAVLSEERIARLEALAGWVWHGSRIPRCATDPS